MKKLSLFLPIYLLILMGCTNEHPHPQIAPMNLSSSQQEIVDLLSHMGSEFLFFEYTSGVFTEIKVWVEVYHYGELLGQYNSLGIFSNTPIEAEPLTVSIYQPGHNKFQWSISIGAGRSTSEPWIAQNEYNSRAFGSIGEPVEIVAGQEIIIYLSKFTSEASLTFSGDLQNYLKYPENLANYTYVHIIKAEFTTR